MEQREEIIRFTDRWIEEFDIWNLKDISFSRMKKDCEDLGFILNHKKMVEIDQIDDAEELGSLIYTQCENVLNDPERIDEFDLWQWFVEALDRLSRIVHGCFFGIPKTIKIDSAPVFFNRLMTSGDEINQEIEINDSGKAKIIRTIYKEKNQTIEVQELQIDESAAKRLMDAFAKYFSRKHEYEIRAEDVGTWTVEMINTKGHAYSFSGSLVRQFILFEDTDLSDLVRETLGMDDLYVMDSEAFTDPIQSIIVEYVHQIVPDTLSIKTYAEQLIIDRSHETIELTRNDANGNRIQHIYHLKNIVKNVLNWFSDDELFYIDEDTEPVYEDPDETRKYTITLAYKYSGKMIIEGKYYKNGLPDRYEEFAKTMISILEQYGSMEMLDPSLYKRVKKAPQYYTYYGVTFDGSKKIYHYLSGEVTLQKGDMVLVPAGKFDQISMAQVESVEIYRDDEVPYPVSRTKQVIKKCTPEEVEYFTMLSENIRKKKKNR